MWLQTVKLRLQQKRPLLLRQKTKMTGGDDRGSVNNNRKQKLSSTRVVSITGRLAQPYY